MASSTLAERLPAICGSDTFTTVVSSTSINVLNITAVATIQGLMEAFGCELGSPVRAAGRVAIFQASDQTGMQTDPESLRRSSYLDVGLVPADAQRDETGNAQDVKMKVGAN